MADKARICKRSYDFETGTVSFAFANGKVLSVTMADIPAVLHPKFALRGLSENLQNTFASAKGDADAAFEAASSAVQTYLKGLYTERVAAEREDPVEILAEAFSRWKTANGAQAPNRDKLLERLKAMPKGDRDKLRRTPAIAAVIAEIKAERKPLAQTPDELIGDLE